MRTQEGHHDAVKKRISCRFNAAGWASGFGTVGRKETLRAVASGCGWSNAAPEGAIASEEDQTRFKIKKSSVIKLEFLKRVNGSEKVPRIIAKTGSFNLFRPN
jgi:hypothetical protein